MAEALFLNPAGDPVNFNGVSPKILTTNIGYGSITANSYTSLSTKMYATYNGPVNQVYVVNGGKWGSVSSTLASVDGKPRSIYSICAPMDGVEREMNLSAQYWSTTVQSPEVIVKIRIAITNELVNIQGISIFSSGAWSASYLYLVFLII